MSQASTCVVPSELPTRLDEVALIDVRTPGEFESARLPHSVNRPLDRIDEHVDELRQLIDLGRPVVLVCQSGNRAMEAQQKLAVAGLPTDVLTGGVEGWRNDGRDVIVDVARWDLNRQVRFVAGSVVLASTLAGTVFPPARVVAGAVGLGLASSAVTNTCGMAMVLARLPYNRARTAQVRS